MAKFTLTIDCDNAAFQIDDAEVDGMGALPEVARILKVLAHKLSDTSDDNGTLLDGNGNKVGSWKYKS